MGVKHEDMDAQKMSIVASSTSSITAFSGTSAARIHHANIYNTSDSLTANVYLKVHEGTLDQDVVLRHTTLRPEQHTTWAGGLGADDIFIIQAVNDDAENTLILDITWW
jgi:hypothetical protein